MDDLTQKKCVPCEGGIPPMKREQAHEYMSQTVGWELSSDDKKIRKEFKFGSFKEAIKFINNVARIAESENHHPDIYIFYNKVELELSTHAIKGLSENDFILAAKINKL
ncbi:MAG: 4a-hydroxytetrahydrobiopterin dehydratase [Candidatus Yanofskybacteria bacterium]|nr:4a-hydroxytetrahydrobiopterin dehydratase [Candidatus Yanofskybacteria bacterium]